MYEYKCNRCEKVEFKSFTSLSRHMCRTHKMKSDQFYVDYYLNGIWPECKCGCKGKVKWSWKLIGFRDYCQGHQARVKNNWGNNPKALERSLNTRKERFASGEITTWNSGLSMDDVRVKNNIEKSTFAINSDPNELKRRSDLMMLNRKNGIMPTLFGPDSSRWKGGVSEINVIARADKRLYDEWKYPILVRDGFKCVECGGNGGGLHIHHDKEKMNEIVKNHMPDMELITDFELKKSIAAKIVDYHIVNKVSGITLCGKCHENKHPSLNFG